MKFQMSQANPWYRRKPYPHFDLPLSEREAAGYVSNVHEIARHPFYPLIQYTLTRPRIKKLPSENGRTFVKEPKLRTIAYPSHKDGYIFAYYKFLLENPYEAWLVEKGLNEAVTAFRSSIKENNITLAKKAFDFIREHPGCEIIATDIESFFDNINHLKLKQIWQSFLGVPRLPADHFAVYKAYYKFLLENPYEAWLVEKGLNEAVTAFRSSIKENNITLAKKAFDFIREHPGCCEIIARTPISSRFLTI